MLDLESMKSVSDSFLKDTSRYLTDQEVIDLFTRTGLADGKDVRMVMLCINQQPRTGRPKARVKLFYSHMRQISVLILSG